jgi:exodeoxyribonuclease VIII
MMQDVMLDLETMGTRSRAAIVAIGAVAFDLETGQLGNIFYQVVDLESSVKAGLEMDADTVMWWLRQNDAARLALTNPIVSAEDLSSTLLRFSHWLVTQSVDGEGLAHDCRVWGAGAGFDNVILRSAYELCGLTLPWKFWNDRCYRTVKNLHPDVVMASREGTHHNALDDALNQTNHLIVMLGPAARYQAFKARGEVKL